MSGASIDLNADVGEGCPDDAALLGLVTSASVACGFHAGDPRLMVETARAALSNSVVLGAHPSYLDREGFGRRPADVPEAELTAQVAYQVGAMAAAAALAGGRLRFVKPHGALYNRACADPATASAVAKAVLRAGGGDLALLCPAGSQLARQGDALGVPTYREAFADRAYAPDGSLLDRSRAGAVIVEPEVVVRQALDLALRGRVRCPDGYVVAVEADSLCIHGDSPGAVDTATAVRSALEAEGVTVTAFLPS